jgi:ATP-dependent DNA helicase RecG
MHQELSRVFEGFTVGLLHGKMKSAEKEAVMAQFKAGRTQVLVSTTVIEVGVDVPNATVMVIEHAERFGLSQLHQLRGRVGRGGGQSYCILLAGYAQSEEGRFRLRVMEDTHDGFVIAEEDLKLRGPGDFLGTKQAGMPDFRLAEIVRDGHLLGAAKKRAEEILTADPDLLQPHNTRLRDIMLARWGKRLDLTLV